MRNSQTITRLVDKVASGPKRVPIGRLVASLNALWQRDDMRGVALARRRSDSDRKCRSRAARAYLARWDYALPDRQPDLGHFAGTRAVAEPKAASQVCA